VGPLCGLFLLTISDYFITMQPNGGLIMSEQQDLSTKEKRIALHLRIWVAGVIATAAFIIINMILSDTYGVSDALFQGVMFLGVWLVLQYLIYRKAFKQFKREESNEEE
ncbi:MAG: hypothetical protein ACQEQA_01850, partial [Bacillota bacterium]